ncbi:sensor histidine kinase [Lysobacter korlensis]|uniref:histidine kinase n=1 Tax=Lysobacter korlensis TaxID=553636 RepID=A0ABV6RTV0_9GAMM
MSRPSRRLQSRLMWGFGGFTVVLVALFALFAMAFAYSVEDAFFQARLGSEADRQTDHRLLHGRWAPVGEGSIRLHERFEQLPAGVRAVLGPEPGRREISTSDGRHYHVHAILGGDGARAWLASEVSDELVVRPMRGALASLLAGAGLVMLLSGLALAWFIARRTTRRLSRLADQVDRLAFDEAAPSFGNLTGGDDEVGMLARRLQSLEERIRAFAERERAFTRDASHELRTPLAVIRSTAERMRASPHLPPAEREHAAGIEQSAMQLEQLILALLTLAREQASKSSGPAVRTPLLPIVERVVVEQSLLLQDRPVTVEVDAPRHAVIDAAEPVVRIILGNLIGNAFAHTASGAIRITADADAISIVNEGRLCGDLADISEPKPFRKGDASPGFGLGLSLVQRVAAQSRLALEITGSEAGVVARLALRTEH